MPESLQTEASSPRSSLLLHNTAEPATRGIVADYVRAEESQPNSPPGRSDCYP
jgi:hypothetical protein